MSCRLHASSFIRSSPNRRSLVHRLCSAGLPTVAARNTSGRLVGLSRFELLTPRLSSVCSNQLSYRPEPVLSKLDRTCIAEVRVVPDRSECLFLAEQVSRKEVIQPQVLLQLPCYDFTPITGHTLSACPPCGLTWRFLVQPAFVM